MFKYLLFIIFAFSGFTGIAQTYTGNGSIGKSACTFKINPDSTVIFVIQDENHGFYEEQQGLIKHLTGNTYEINAQIIFGAYLYRNGGNTYKKYCISFRDTNCNLRDDISQLTVRYDNGKVASIVITKKIMNQCYVDRRYVNKRHRGFSIFPEHKNPLTNKKIFINSGIGSCVEFESCRTLKFEVTLNPYTIETVSSPPIQSGNFKLTKINN